MACKNVCRLCNNLIISETVEYTAPNVVVTIPAGSYNNCQKYCIVLAQAVPDTALVNAPVVIEIGDGAEQYPVVQCNGTPLTARYLSTRTKYSTILNTNVAGGAVFKMLGKVNCIVSNSVQSVDGTAPA